MDLTEKTENIERHPWELSRSYSMLRILSKNDKNTVYADIGAGDKYFASKLSFITDGKVYAIDNEYKLDKIEEDGIFCLNDICLLENDSIDSLIMMDVLEHIENADEFLKEVLTKLKPGGKIFITVPAMQFLFSSHDVFLKHYRRYSKKKLHKMLNTQNVIIEESNYFYTTLFFLRCISLLYEKIRFNSAGKSTGIGMWSYSDKSFITRSLFHLLNIDFFICKLFGKFGIYIPGLSLLSVCRKKL